MDKKALGPWTISNAYGNGTAIWISADDQPKMVLQGAQCLRSDTVTHEQIDVDQLQKNAALMAAAPELLILLKKAQRLGLDFSIGNAYIRRAYIDEQTALNVQIDALIAKATRAEVAA